MGYRKSPVRSRNRVSVVEGRIPHPATGYAYLLAAGAVRCTASLRTTRRQDHMKLSTAFAFTLSVVAAASAQATDLVIATVNNGHMVEMQKHTKEFEAANPGITLKWVTLEEGVLRSRVTTDIATKGGQFDV